MTQSTSASERTGIPVNHGPIPADKVKPAAGGMAFPSGYACFPLFLKRGTFAEIKQSTSFEDWRARHPAYPPEALSASEYQDIMGMETFEDFEAYIAAARGVCQPPVLS